MTADRTASLRTASERPAQTIDWVARARALRPVLEATAPEIEASSGLPESLLDQIHAARLYRLLIPWEYGGAQVDPMTFAGVIEAIAEGDASTAWCLSQGSVCSTAAAYLPQPTAQRVFGDDPRVVIAWGAAPSGKAVETEGGWRITGSWSYASGSRHATWMGGRCPLQKADGTPYVEPNGAPTVRMFLFPKGTAKMIPAWDVLGLRGTGSDSYSVEDLFVPAELCFDVYRHASHPGTLYRLAGRHLFAPGVAAVALGLARAMLDSFIEIARDPKRGMRDSGAIHSGLGIAEARWASARHALYGSLAEVWREIEAGSEETIDHEIALRGTTTYAITEAAAVAEFAYLEAGTAAVRTSLPFERRVRDMQTLLQHGQSKRTNFEKVGKYRLGLDPGPIIL